MKNHTKILLFVMFLLLTSCSYFIKNSDEPEPSPEVQVTKELCDASGGNWNECSSPCLGTGADYCIEVCAVQCECGGIAGFNCPDGFKCRLTEKIADELGACIPE